MSPTQIVITGYTLLEREGDVILHHCSQDGCGHTTGEHLERVVVELEERAAAQPGWRPGVIRTAFLCSGDGCEHRDTAPPLRSGSESAESVALELKPADYDSYDGYAQELRDTGVDAVVPRAGYAGSHFLLSRTRGQGETVSAWSWQRRTSSPEWRDADPPVVAHARRLMALLPEPDLPRTLIGITVVEGGSDVIMAHTCGVRACPHTTEAHVAQIVTELRMNPTGGLRSVHAVRTIFACTATPCPHVAEDGGPLPAERDVGELLETVAEVIQSAHLVAGDLAPGETVGHVLETLARGSQAASGWGTDRHAMTWLEDSAVLDAHVERLERFQRRHTSR